LPALRISAIFFAELFFSVMMRRIAALYSLLDERLPTKVRRGNHAPPSGRRG
jgi:hypothetical protein